jgi:hypothetical protein
MGDFGLNQTFEYTELVLDSWDSATTGGQFFEGSTSNTNLIQYSWPQFFFTQKKPRLAGLKVIQAEIPFVYDVITTSNNQFVYTNNGVPTTVTIPVGTYTGPALATQLQTLLAAITLGFTVAWSSTTLKFTFTYPSVFAWSLTFANRDTPYSVMGFVPTGNTNTGIYSATGFASTIVSNTIAQVSGPYYLYVNSNKIGSLINFNLPDQSPDGGTSSELCRIPVNVQYGSVIFYTDPCPRYMFDFFASNQFTSFDFYLTLGSDQYQKPLDLKGSPWSLKLGLLTYREASADLYEKPTKRQNRGMTVIGL